MTQSSRSRTGKERAEAWGRQWENENEEAWDRPALLWAEQSGSLGGRLSERWLPEWSYLSTYRGNVKQALWGQRALPVLRNSPSPARWGRKRHGEC